MVDTLGEPEFDAVLIDGRCAPEALASEACVGQGMPCGGTASGGGVDDPPLGARSFNPGCILHSTPMLCRFRVACALKILNFLTEGSVVMVHDWKQR